MEGDSLLFGMMENEGDPRFQLDPWELPPYFFLRHKLNYEELKKHPTPSGFWREIEDESIAIRSGDESSFSCSPSYQGVRRTLQFYRNDGTTKDWLIHDYQYLHNKAEAGATVLLEEDVVLRKVFKEGETDQSSSLCHQEVKSCVKAYKEAYPAARCGERLSLLGGISFLLGSVHYYVFHCDTGGETDNVWKHFTKIRTNDPDVVYAACHHCDKLLKAHPKKHGTSQLERHMNSDKCRSCCSNPSTDEDREMLRLLRTVLDDPDKQQKMDEKLDCQEDLNQLDPWDPNLAHPTPWYITRSFNRQTQGGHWKEIRKEFTAIRMEDQQMQGRWMEDITVFQKDQLQLQMQVPQPPYMGLRRTLQFHHQDGRKMDWIMLEYQRLDAIEPAALFLPGDLVIRKVFRYDKDAVTTIFSDLNKWLNGDDDSEEYYYNGEAVNTEITTSSDYMNGGANRKRKRSAASKRTSEVWMYFTEIRTADNDVVYAVCHHCDRVYSSGRSTNGTSHLWRHKKSCTSKPPGTGNTNNGSIAKM